MDEQTFEIMEKYVANKLAPAEKARFEQKMEQNPELKAEVELHRKLMKSVETEGVRQMLEQIHQQQLAASATGSVADRQETPVVRFKPARQRLALAAAATVALLLVAGWWAFSLQQSRPEALYADYFAPANGLPTTLGVADDPLFAEGMVSYKLGEYPEALAAWQPLLAQATANDTLSYFAGVALLASQQPQKAESYLRQVARTGQSAYAGPARWYLGLALLLNGQQAEAREVLSELLATENPYREKSRELLEKIQD